MSEMWLGLGKHMVPLPGFIWRRRVCRDRRLIAAGLSFMTEKHHIVRNFVVRKIADTARPVSVDTIREETGLPPDRIASILDELEKNLTFLYRNPAGEVAWAYPVTAEPTPHRISFASGQIVNAA